MMVALLLYAYAIGERSSRGIERHCREDVAFRVITANPGAALRGDAGRPRRAVPRKPPPGPPRGEPDKSPANRDHRKSPVTRAFSVAGL